MNCHGCREEKAMAYESQCNGFHVATTPDNYKTYPVGNHHYLLLIVDDKGRVVIQ